MGIKAFIAHKVLNAWIIFLRGLVISYGGKKFVFFEESESILKMFFNKI